MNNVQGQAARKAHKIRPNIAGRFGISVVSVYLSSRAGPVSKLIARIVRFSYHQSF